jgi:hypothetical protein
MKAYRVNGNKAPQILNHGTRWRLLYREAHMDKVTKRNNHHTIHIITNNIQISIVVTVVLKQN